MWRNLIIATSILVVSVLHYGNGARILGIFPTPSISHQVVFRGLVLALNKRGHELVVVTPNPVNDPTLKNYTEIDISFLYEQMIDINFMDIRGKLTWIDFFKAIEPEFGGQYEQILSYPKLRQLYEPNSNEKFDLVMMEMLCGSAFLQFAKRFDAPLIGITSLGLPINIEYAIGSPIMPSHLSAWEIASTDSKSLTFWDRLDRFIKVWRYIYFYKTVFMEHQQAIADKYFGNGTGIQLTEIERNISLMFVNQQTPISYVKPTLPNVIEIGGFHVSKQIQTLPKDLQKILDEATEGFIYMSLGSNVKSKMLTDKARGEFVAAFASLPYKVLWKFEDDAFPGKPDNVIIMKWTPQQAVLAHPNLKAFIYQGGLQSTEEAIAHAVPLIGFAVLADQDLQVNKMTSLGVAKKLEITNVNRNDLLEAIRAVTLDPGYKQRMLSLRSLINDRPNDVLENAVWWTEYVIRHRGAPHLRSSTADEPWYIRQDMDIVAFISAGSVVAFSLVLVVLYKFLVYSITVFNYLSVNEKQKRN